MIVFKKNDTVDVIDIQRAESKLERMLSRMKTPILGFMKPPAIETLHIITTTTKELDLSKWKEDIPAIDVS